MTIDHLIVGSDRHGVVRFGLALQERLEANGVPVAARRTVGSRAGRGLHLQFTDRLFGSAARRAASAVSDLAVDVHRGGARITATLHDVPQPSDGAHYSTRATAYLSLATELDGVVVSSDHERDLLHAVGFRGEAAVVPLPIPMAALGHVESQEPLSVAVFGFIYPGKGHAEVLGAMRHLPSGVRMMAIGEPSAGHDDLVEELTATARAQHRPFDLTGHVPDGALVPLLRTVTVPVAHHRHVSASGSLNSWLTAGRRPLVPATRYTREIAARNPGALLLYDDARAGLPSAIRAALDEPGSTWLSAAFVCSPTPDQAARCYGTFLRDVHR